MLVTCEASCNGLLLVAFITTASGRLRRIGNWRNSAHAFLISASDAGVESILLWTALSSVVPVCTEAGWLVNTQWWQMKESWSSLETKTRQLYHITGCAILTFVAVIIIIIIIISSSSSSSSSSREGPLIS